MSHFAHAGRAPAPLRRCLLPCLLLAIAPTLQAASTAEETDRAPAAVTASAHSPAQKPARIQPGPHDSRDYIEVKFAEGLQVRLQGGHLAPTQAGTPLAGAAQTQAAQALAALTRGAGPVAEAEPLFRASPASLEALARAAQAQSGRRQADLSQWFRLRLRPGQDIAAVVAGLNALDAVEIAYPAPLPTPLPATPDYQSHQRYRGPATGGIDSAYARTLPGGDGTGVRVLDIEYSWNTAHEDLPKLRAAGARVANGTPQDPFSDSGHGTSVAGQLVAADNGLGVTGLVPGASFHYTNAMNTERGYDLANAVLTAAGALRAGDVILIEQQAAGPSGCSGYVPVEWIPSVYDAVVAAVSRGIHVVQAGGNGNMNLDNTACFGSPFPRGRADSGAIIVGAGGPEAMSWCGDRTAERARQPFSSYGRRFNLQAWGNCVVTTGYGDLYDGGANADYTHTFSGTSSASPIVASAVAALSGIAKARGIALTPAQMRELLVSTGTPQAGSGTPIGPLPNLRAAAARLGRR